MSELTRMGTVAWGKIVAMNPLEIRRSTDSDAQVLLSIDEIAFGASLDRSMRSYPGLVAHTTPYGWCVVDGDQVVGAAAAFEQSITVPGGADVRCPGLTSVGVRPTHRRRGALRMMMAQVLQTARQHEQPLMGLNASETAIYGRFGFGRASSVRFVSIDTHRAAFRHPEHEIGSVRQVSIDEARLTWPRVHEQYRAVTVGAMSCPESIWDMFFEDHASRRRGASELFHIVHLDAGGSPDGFVSYRVAAQWRSNGPAHELRIEMLASADPQVVLGLLRFVMSVDLVASVTAGRPLREPLEDALVEPRDILTTGLRDHNWLRIVDPVAVFGARLYLNSGRFVVGFVDPMFDDLSANYMIEVAGDEVHVEPTQLAADLTAGAAEWAGIFIGETDPRSFAVTGRAHGDAGLAAEFFRWTSAPYCDVHYLSRSPRMISAMSCISSRRPKRRSHGCNNRSSP